MATKYYHPYVFNGLTSSGEIVFSDTYWYHKLPTERELAEDLEMYVTEQGAIYNHEHGLNIKWKGSYEPIEAIAIR